MKKVTNYFFRCWDYLCGGKSLSRASSWTIPVCPCKSESEFSTQPSLPPLPSEDTDASDLPPPPSTSSSEKIDVTMEVGLFEVGQNQNDVQHAAFTGMPLSIHYSPCSQEERRGLVPDLEFDMSFCNRPSSRCSFKRKEERGNTIIECQIPESVLSDPRDSQRCTTCSCYVKQSPSIQQLETLSRVGKARKTGCFGEFVLCNCSDRGTLYNTGRKLSCEKLSEHLLDVDATLKDVQDLQIEMQCYR